MIGYKSSIAIYVCIEQLLNLVHYKPQNKENKNHTKISAHKVNTYECTSRDEQDITRESETQRTKSTLCSGAQALVEVQRFESSLLHVVELKH